MTIAKPTNRVGEREVREEDIPTFASYREAPLCFRDGPEREPLQLDAEHADEGGRGKAELAEGQSCGQQTITKGAYGADDEYRARRICLSGGREFI